MTTSYFGEPLDLPGCLECGEPSDTWICVCCEESARSDPPTDFAGWPASRPAGAAAAVPA